MEREELISLIIKILEQENKPLEVKYITKKVKISGYSGSGSFSNLSQEISIYLSQEINHKHDRSRFIRISRGTYGLIGWAERYGINLEEFLNNDSQKHKKEKYDEYGFTNIADRDLLNKLKDEIISIKSYLKGSDESIYNDDNLCFWVWVCYKFGFYREAIMIFNRIDSNKSNKGLYEIAEKIFYACELNVK